MSFISKSKAEPILGANVGPKGVTFRVWAPFASRVAVIGSFNEWNKDTNPLTGSDSGVWTGAVANAEVGQEYKYVITHGDQTFERNDPCALQLTAAQDASVIIDDNMFDWGGDNFVIAPPNERVVYELHVGTFSRPDPATPGTFHDVIAKLDYLADLGVNVIEVMPVSGTNVDRWWGYDPTYLYAVESAYGGRKAFMELVKSAHQRGIAVIVDVVYNHLSPFPGLDLWRFDGWCENDGGGIYFYNDDRRSSPWGPRPDYGRPEVRHYISENAAMWIRDCHVDGIRVDATFAIRNIDGGTDHAKNLPDGWRVLQEITTASCDANPHAMVVAEDMAMTDAITQPVSAGGAGFTSQWETSFPFVLRDVLNPPSDEQRTLQGLLNAIAKSYNGDPFQRVVYSESHDADANGHARMNEEITPGQADSVWARRRTALAAVIIMTAPGIPMLFQGQEFLEDGWFNHWKSLDWGKAGEHSGIRQLYRDLIALRRNLRGVTAGLLGKEFDVLHCNEQAKVIAYSRSGSGSDAVVVALNFSNMPHTGYEITFPCAGTWKARFNSDWQGYSSDYTNTPTPDVDVSDSKAGTINLGPYSAVIYSL